MIYGLKEITGTDSFTGQTLLRRLRIALEERQIQVDSFQHVNDTLEDSLREDWEAMVADWLADRTRPNPYAPAGKGTNVPLTIVV